MILIGNAICSHGMAQILNTFSDSVTLGSTEISLGLQKTRKARMACNFRHYCATESVHVGVHVELMQVKKNLPGKSSNSSESAQDGDAGRY